MGKGRETRPRRLGKKLRMIRQHFGLSQNEMLRKLGLNEDWTREEVSAYERGTRVPPLNVLLAYSTIANVWVNVLIDDDLELPADLPTRKMHGGTRRSLQPKGP